MTKNRKSDVAAKTAFIELLQKKGYVATIAAAPADIVAQKNGETWYFEIKMTNAQKDKSYFGAATITEWKQALNTPEHFRFVIAYKGTEEGEFEFKEYTPQEFMAFSTVPPFKVYFNIPGTTKNTQSKKKKKALVASESVLNKLDDFYNELRK